MNVFYENVFLFLCVLFMDLESDNKDDDTHVPTHTHLKRAVFTIMQQLKEEASVRCVSPAAVSQPGLQLSFCPRSGGGGDRGDRVSTGSPQHTTSVYIQSSHQNIMGL